MCIATGLVGGEAFSIDASLIKADVDKKKRMPGDQPVAWPKVEEASHAVREYLAALDTARGDEDGSGDAGGSGKGSDRHKPPKEVSLTDPQATWVARPGVDPFFAYDANYLIDNKAGIIIDTVGTRANRTVEIAITQTMVDRVERRFDLRPQRLAGDTVYGAVRLLKWLVDRNTIKTLAGKGARAQSRRYALNERKAPSPRRTMAPAMIAPVIWPIPAAIAASPVGKSIRARPPRTNSQPRTVTSTGHPFVQRL
jgi:hypothetical protein